MLITLSGIDCAGKSTQIDLLKRALRSRGLSVGYLWYRPGYSDELDTLRLWIRQRSSSALPQAGESARRQQIFSRAGVSSAWIAVALLDTLAQYGLKLRALLARHDVVICDRYLADASIDLSLRFPSHGAAYSLPLRLISSLSPSPCAQLLLTISESEMLARMDRKQEPFPDPPKIRARRYQAYQALACSPQMTVIDAQQPIDAVHRSILARLPAETLP